MHAKVAVTLSASQVSLSHDIKLSFACFVLQLGGFVITKQVVHPWVVWLYWTSPMQVRPAKLYTACCVYQLPQMLPQCLPSYVPRGNCNFWGRLAPAEMKAYLKVELNCGWMDRLHISARVALHEAQNALGCRQYPAILTFLFFCSMPSELCSSTNSQMGAGREARTGAQGPTAARLLAMECFSNSAFPVRPFLLKTIATLSLILYQTQRTKVS